MDTKEKQELSKWEMGYVDSSGIFSVRFDRWYHFIVSSLTERWRENRDLSESPQWHVKKKHLPSVSFLQFASARVGVCSGN